MHSDNRASPRGHSTREIGRIDVVSVWTNVGEDWFGTKRADGAARGDECERRNQHFVTGLNAARAHCEYQGICSGRDPNAMRYTAELRDFLFKRGAFAAQNELLRRENSFDGGSNLRADGRVLRREIKLRHGIEQGSGLWVRAHRFFIGHSGIGAKCRVYAIDPGFCASRLYLYNDAPNRMFAKRTNWNLETNRLGAALAVHRAAGKPLIDLTVSNPTECGFRYDDESILNALRNPAALKYDPNPRGLAVARSAVAQYYAERTTIVSNDDIFLTTSTSEAYSYVFRTLCNPDDELLIPAPSYPLFEFLADIQDVRLARYPLVYDYGWQIDFHALEQAITPRTRGVIVVHPNNPTGHFTKPEEMRKLNEICAAHEIAIIADEVFLDFALKERQIATFAANSGALTFTMSGLSKICGLPQMKAAWLVVSGPAALKAEALARLEMIADTYLSMSAPIQWAMPAFLGQRHTFQEQVTARANENLTELDKQLGEQTSCSRLEVEGGWNAVIRVPVDSFGRRACARITRRKVTVCPSWPLL